MSLVTAQEYIDRWDYLETGRLLTRNGVVDDTTVDTPEGYENVMSSGGSLVTDVETALRVVLDQAEAFVEAYTTNLYTFPITKDGFNTSTPEIIKYIVLVFARYYLHDQNYQREEIPEVVFVMYDEYKETLMKIDTGEIELESVDKDQEDITNYYI